MHAGGWSVCREMASRAEGLGDVVLAGTEGNDAEVNWRVLDSTACNVHAMRERRWVRRVVCLTLRQALSAASRAQRVEKNIEKSRESFCSGGSD